MKILFAPSEGKVIPQDLHKSHLHKALGEDSCLLPPIRAALEAYREYLMHAPESKIATLFGSKALDMHTLALCQNILNTPRIQAIELYNGVAYKALDFEHLDTRAKAYICENVYIFSNLFGAVQAGEYLPYYNLHQGKGVGAFELKTLYRGLKAYLDAHFKDSQVLDLRPEIYMKAYSPSVHCHKVEFLKNAKKLSHYAKFYRGLYVRTLAQMGITSTSELEKLEFPSLKLIDFKQLQNATILTYDIRS